METLKVKAFDVSQYLKTPELQRQYLEQCFKEDSGDGRLIRYAIGAIVRAQGVGVVSERANITRQGLTKAFSENGNPSMGTFLKVLKAIGIQLSLSNTVT